MSMTRTVADKAMTNAQMLRHLRRHPHRRAVAMLLWGVAVKHCGPGWYPRPWAIELRTIAMGVV